MKIIYIVCLLFILMSHRPVPDGNMYFHKITLEITPVINQMAKIAAIQKRELEKFNRERDEKYLMSSKYAELFLYRNNTNKQIPLVYKLLKLNNNRYEYISMLSYYSVAITMENTSPELAMNFIDKAIEYNKTLSRFYYTGHLYHMKGRFYYNNKTYASALYHFTKALKSFKPDDHLYTSSMYNNFGLTYYHMNQVEKAVHETKKGIGILESKNHLNKEESDFLMNMKGNLGLYYFKLKKYSASEKLLLTGFEYSHGKKELTSYLIRVAERLFDLYSFTGQKAEQKKIVDYLIHNESLFKDTLNKITVNEIVQKYYSAHNDIEHLKAVSKKLVVLNHIFDDENRKNIQKTSDLLNKSLIGIANERHEHEIKLHKKKVLLTVAICCLLIIIIVLIAFNIWTKKIGERKEVEKERESLETKKKMLEQDVLFHKEKIKNLHQNLNLKIETEKAFLQNVKKIKRTKDVDHEKIFRDLYLKVSNLIQIDKKNDDFVNESSIENKMFLKKLKNTYPFLTPKELKLCTYFRMNLSSKEISILEDTTTATVRVYKTRIKNKAGLGRQDDLNIFLNELSD